MQRRAAITQTDLVSGVPVVVVGAGPVGLTAALLLARRGLEVLVLERHRSPYPLPRAVHLDDEVFRVLQDAGVADDVARIGRPMTGLRLLDGRHSVLAEFDRPVTAGVHGWPQGSLLHQPDLEAVLETALDREAGATLVRGAEVRRIAQDDDGVTLTVADRDTGVERSVRGRAVLGCDGANSTVRRCIGATMRDLGPADRWLVLDVRSQVALPVGDGANQVCDSRRPATFMHVTGDRYRWEFRMAAGETVAELTSPARLRELLEPVDPVSLEIVRAAEYTFRAQLVDRWRESRVLLAGDAAHLTPPFVGQGLGLGLRDVHQLVWKLDEVLTRGAGDDLLDTYAAERAPHARALIRIALLVGRLMTGGGRSAAVLRRGVLVVAPRVPVVARLATDSATPPLRSGPLVERRGRSGRRLAGTLVPQPEVVVDGRHCRLDGVLGSGSVELRADGEAFLVLRDDGTSARFEDPSGTLRRWLHGATWVQVRPDRIVRSAG